MTKKERKEGSRKIWIDQIKTAMRKADKEYRKLIKKLNELMDFASNLSVTHKKREYAEFRIKLRSAYKMLNRIEIWIKEIKEK